MGSYCDLYIGKYPLYSTKNYLDYKLLTNLFRPEDLTDKKKKDGR